MPTTDPWKACLFNTDGNATDPSGSTVSWLYNGIAYSGEGVMHSCYFSIIFILAALSRAVFKRTSMLHGGKLTSSSHVLVLLVVGMILSSIVELFRIWSTPDCLRGVWMISSSGSIQDGMDISYLYFGLLPLLLFKPSLEIDGTFFIRNVDTILIQGLATLLSVICCMTVIITFLINPFYEIARDSTGFPAYGEFRSFAFSGMLAVTLVNVDSRFILNLLNEVGSGKQRLSQLIDNGSWVASVMASMLFEVFRIAVQASENWAHSQWLSALTYKIVLSPVIGIFVGRAMSGIMNRIINDVLAEVLLVVACVYFTVASSEILGLCGPLAVITLNFVMDHSAISKDGEETLKQFLDSASFFCAVYLAGTCGFVWMEQMIDEVMFVRGEGSFTWTYIAKDFFWIFILYISVIILRIIAITITSKVLNNRSIEFRHAVFMGWGELPGSLNMILALVALLDPNLNWASCEGEGRFNPLDPFHGDYEGRIIGTCDGEVDIPNIQFLWSNPYNSTLSEMYYIAKQKTFFYGIGVLILCQFINALSLDKVVSKLGIYRITSVQKSTMQKAMKKIRDDVVQSQITMRYDSFLADANWEHVTMMSHISNPYTEMNDLGGETKQRDRNRANSRRLSEDLTQDLRIINPDLEGQLEGTGDLDADYQEARQRAMNAMKTSFVRQRNQGHLTDDAVVTLKQAIDSVQADRKSVQLVSSTMLRRNWKLYGIWPKLKNIIEKQLYSNKKEIRNPYKINQRKKRGLFKFSLSQALETIMQIIILLNVVQLGLESYWTSVGNEVEDKDSIDISSYIIEFPDTHQNKAPLYYEYDKQCTENKYQCLRFWLEVANWCFIGLYILEVIFKYSIQGGKIYVSNYWHIFDLIIVFVSTAETISVSIIEAFVVTSTDEVGGNLSFLKAIKLVKMIKVIRVFRIARVLRFTKTLVPYVLGSLNKRLAFKIRAGYDIGQGFIRATDELESALDMIAGELGSNKEMMRRILEKTKSSIVRDLGLLQRDYPGIATAVKTKTAIRNLINVMHDSVRRLQESGILDDFEVRILHDQVNILVKQLWLLPIEMEPTDPENLFMNIHWVGNDRRLSNYLLENSTIHHFDMNDMVIQDDEEPDAIYLIISGLVKIVHGHYRHKKITDDSDEEDSENEDEAQVCDYASTGIVVGEMGALLGENARVSVVCETAVETYQIPVEVIRKAYSEFPKLLDTLWSVVGMKIAVPLMMKETRYQGFTQDEVRKTLQSNYVANFEARMTFEITNDISEIILLDGAVAVEGEFTSAPSLIRGSDDPIYSKIIHIQERAVLMIFKKSSGIRSAKSAKSNQDKFYRNSVVPSFGSQKKLN